MTPDDCDARRAELAKNLDAVRERIATACRTAGRDPGEVRLVVVTKTYPAADVLRLVWLGVRDVGENRDHEAAAKAAKVAAAGAAGADVRWHFVGHLQRNKCRSVVRYAAMVHSVDSVRLARALDHAAREHADESANAGPATDRLAVLVQVSLDGDPTRGGAVLGGGDEDVALDRVVDAIANAQGLRFRGLMAVAPLHWDPDAAFATLAAIVDRVRAGYPDATVLSAGMSGDLEQAIRHGATHVRVGSAVLGERPPLR
ncbi:MAG TPA: YggS family pyridoxal phosphate-dependent enzyme [Micromonosporaceae bacterium]